MHVQFSYDDRSVVVVNDLPEAFAGLKVKAQLLDFGLAIRSTQEARVDVAADGVTRAFAVPQPRGLSTAYFLRLRLEDSTARPLSTNFYWLSTREDVLDWEKTEWYYTPTRRHADLRALARLPPTTLALRTGPEEGAAEPAARVRVENTGRALAFQVHLKLVDAASGDELLPVFWDDNYFELVPGEVREVRVAYPPRRDAAAPRLEAEAWNVPLTRP